MTTSPSHDTRWLDTRETLDASELAHLCGLSEAELHELLDYGAVAPLSGSGQLSFSAHWVAPLRTACRLRTDFELDLFTMALLLDYLGRIATLEQELEALRARLPAHLQA